MGNKTHACSLQDARKGCQSGIWGWAGGSQGLRAPRWLRLGSASLSLYLSFSINDFSLLSPHKWVIKNVIRIKTQLDPRHAGEHPFITVVPFLQGPTGKRREGQSRLPEGRPGLAGGEGRAPPCRPPVTGLRRQKGVLQCNLFTMQMKWFHAAD